jgi:D-serine deaminase-like pyridoxal phosphate-dependent protein
MRGVTISDLRTPHVLVDRPRVFRNLSRLQEAVNARGLALRPHAKTHKLAWLAYEQVARGAVGVCCAKLGEAEVLANAGVADILLPYPLNPINADRVVALQDRIAVSFIVDDLGIARDWSTAMVARGRRADVLVKIDVGFHRCGIDPSRIDAVQFVTDVAALPGIRLRGLLSHAGQCYHAPDEGALAQMARDERDLMVRVADGCRARGVAIDTISMGATPISRFSLGLDGFTELRIGNYTYFDRTQVGLGAATWDDCALTVVAMVVSRPAPDRVILDCGSKTLSNDLARGFGPMPGHGALLRDLVDNTPDPGCTIERLSEEHATVRVEGACDLRIGDRVRVVPNHSCVVSNLVDAVALVDGLSVIDILPVTARGRIS